LDLCCRYNNAKNKNGGGLNMSNEWGTQPIGSIVAHLPAASEVFKRSGIDFCCGGSRILSEAIKEQGLNGSEVYEALDSELESAKNRSTADFTSMTPSELSSHIETKHHSYLREALPQISELLGSVLKAHGRNHPELFKVHGLFGTLRTDLEQHLIKEETILFPALSEGDGLMRDLSREIKEEHEGAGRILKELRSITNDYTVPADGCPTFRRLYRNMEEMEADLFEHIHLENNILLRGM
jgi:regulator of cell morphogenesis and NO signaling